MKTLIIFFSLFCFCIYSQSDTSLKIFKIKPDSNSYLIYSFEDELLLEFTPRNTDSLSLETLQKMYSITSKVSQNSPITIVLPQASNYNLWIILLTSLIAIFTMIYSGVSYLTHKATKPILKMGATRIDGKMTTVQIINCAPHNIAIKSIYSRRRYLIRKPFKSVNQFIYIYGLKKYHLWSLYYDFKNHKDSSLFHHEVIKDEAFIDIEFNRNELSEFIAVYAHTTAGKCKKDLPKVGIKKSEDDVKNKI